MGRTLSASTSTPIAAHAAIHRARSSGKAAPELKSAPAQPEHAGPSRGCFIAQETAGEEPNSPGECRSPPAEPSPPIPINNPAPAQPEIRSEQRLFCCAGNRRRGAGLLRRVPPITRQSPSRHPINNPAPAQPEIRTEQGLWRLGYAEGAEVPASVSRTSTRRVISRLQVKRVISHSPASRAAGSSASISVIPVT